ncbi:MAG: hypothetical protein MUF12_06865 [Sediminibacterium sp.]|jgi:hypothetical protein|nr:hypothetical protein [Sediminibacterium sp.]
MDLIENISINSYVGRINRKGEVHLPDGYIYKLISVGHFESEVCFFDEIPAQLEEWRKIDNSDLCGIPLSEGWLVENFGFQRFPWGYVKDDVLIHCSFSISNEQKYWIEVGNGFRAYLKYVHELQNLWKVFQKKNLMVLNLEYV